MRVVQLCTMIAESSAYYRLQNALKQKGIESVVYTGECNQDLADIEVLQYSVWNKLKKKFLTPVIRKWIEVRYKKEKRMPFSLSFISGTIPYSKIIAEADIIHLHWICGFLSPKMIKKLCELKKTVVWTCHDSWPFTGGCHVRYNCSKYQRQCEKCPILGSEYKNDLSTFIFLNKKKQLTNLPITFIAPSNWMKQNIEKSALFGNNKCYVIPNTLDLDSFNQKNIQDVMQRLDYRKDFSKIHLLFGSVVVKIPYKGVSCLLEALTQLWEKNREIASRIVIHFVGADKCEAEILKFYECKSWGYVSEQKRMADIYNIADVFVFPTLEDNLPGMVMESLACATPVATFNTGGVSDMVIHKENGYIARHGDSGDLLQGILWIIKNNKDNCLGKNGRAKIEKDFNPELIAQKHIDLYQMLLAGSEK